MKTTFYDGTGLPVDASVATDERGVIRHGFTMRTNLLMMDSADVAPLRRPGSFAMSDAELDARSADIEARDAILSNAWRNPSAVVHQQVAPVVPHATTDMGAVYEHYDRRLQDAWKGTAL
jgi:hypothetical protein